MAVKLLILVSLVGLSWFAFYCFASRLFAPGSREEIRFLAGLSFGAGPIAMIWIFTTALLVIDGSLLTAHLVTVLILAVAVYVWRDELKPLPRCIDAEWAWRAASALPMLAVVGAIAGILTVLAFSLPFNQNDPLEYAAVARQIFNTESIRNYPSTDPGTVYGPWTHPPAFVGMMTWLQSFLGDFEHTGLSRLIAPYFTVATVLILIAVSGPAVGAAASLMLLTTFWYWHSVASAHIDPLRIYAFTAAILLAGFAVTPRRAVAAGLMCGLALFAHSAGVLALGASVAIMLLLGARQGRLAYRETGLLVGVALAVVGIWWLRNLSQIGTLVSDSHAVWNLPELSFLELQARERGISSLAERLGAVFRGLSDFEGFGVWLYAAIGSAVLLAISTFWRRTPLPAGSVSVLLASGTAILFWFAFAFAITLAGSDAAIRNPRYPLTFQPLIALFAASAFAASLPALPRPRLLGFSFAVLVVFGLYSQHLISPLVNFAIRDLDRFGYIYRDLGKPGVLSMPDLAKAKRQDWSLYKVIDRYNAAGSGCLLTMRYSDPVFYANGCVINPIDPRLVPVYTSKTPEEAAQSLAELDVEYLLFNYANRHAIDQSELRAIVDQSQLAYFAADKFETWYLYWTDRPRLPVGAVVASASHDDCLEDCGSGQLRSDITRNSVEIALKDGSGMPVEITGGEKALRVHALLSGRGIVSLRLVRKDGEHSNPFWRGLLTSKLQGVIEFDVGLPMGVTYEPVLEIAVEPDSEVNFGDIVFRQVQPDGYD